MTHQPDRETLLELLAAIPDVVVLVAADRTVRFVNRTFMGMRPEDMVGLDVMDPVPPEEFSPRSEALDRAFATMERLELLAHQLRDGYGGLEWFDTVGIPLVRDGRAEHVVLVSTNVTERVLAERERAVLERVLPMCAWCDRVRREDGAWESLEEYVERTADETLTPGRCPTCEGATSG